MTLAEFLLARIAEDEAAARSCGVIYWRSWIEGRDGWGGSNALLMNAEPTNGVAFVDVEGWPTDETQDHAARHDPSRVLAECEAKRRIVELHSDGMTATGRYDAACHVDGCGLPSPDDCYTLRVLATVYADHPDCQPEWKP